MISISDRSWARQTVAPPVGKGTAVWSSLTWTFASDRYAGVLRRMKASANRTPTANTSTADGKWRKMIW